MNTTPQKQEKLVYENTLPHFLIGSLDDATEALIVGTIKEARSLDTELPILIPANSEIVSLIRFYRSSFTQIRLTLCTSDIDDAATAVEEGIAVEINGQRIDTRVLNFADRALAKLLFADEEDADYYADRALREQLNDFPFTTEEQAVDRACATSPFVNREWLTAYGHNIMQRLEQRILSTVTVPNFCVQNVVTEENFDDKKITKKQNPKKDTAPKEKKDTGRTVRVGGVDYQVGENKDTAQNRNSENESARTMRICGVDRIVERVSGQDTVTKQQPLAIEKVAEAGTENLTPREKLILSIMEGGSYIHRGAHASGKSEMAREIVRANLATPSRRTVIITHRRSIANSCMQGVEGVVHYEDVKPGTEGDIRALVICVNSIIRPNLDEFLRNVDTVIVEEAAQTLRHIAYGTVENRAEVKDALSALLTRANIRLLLDADTNRTVTDFLKKVDPRAPITLIDKPVDMSHVTVELMRYEQAEGMLEGMLNAGPVAIATDSKRKVDKLGAKIKKVFDDKKVLKIHSDNIDSDAQAAFVKDPNGECVQYDSLIYSPAITSSLSITNMTKFEKHIGLFLGNVPFRPALTSPLIIINPHFKQHIGLFSGIVPAGDAIQQLRRNRPCERFTVGVRTSGDYKQEFPAQILQGNPEPSDFDRWAAKIEADDNFIRNNIQAAIFILAKHYGFTVIVAKDDAETFKEGEYWDKSATMIEGHEYRRNILASNDPKATTAKSDYADPKSMKKRKSESGGELDETTAIELERSRIMETTGKQEIDKNDVAAWSRGMLAVQVKHLELARACEAECIREDRGEKNGTSHRSMSKKAYRDLNRFLEHRDTFRIIFDDLGLNPFNGKGEFDSDNAKRVIERLQTDRKRFNSLHLRTKIGTAPVKVGTRKVKSILEEFGLEIESRETGADDSRKRQYSITPASWAKMSEYLGNREKNNLTIIKRELQPHERIKFMIFTAIKWKMTDLEIVTRELYLHEKLRYMRFNPTAWKVVNLKIKPAESDEKMKKAA